MGNCLFDMQTVMSLHIAALEMGEKYHNDFGGYQTRTPRGRLLKEGNSVAKVVKRDAVF